MVHLVFAYIILWTWQRGPCWFHVISVFTLIECRCHWGSEGASPNLHTLQIQEKSWYKGARTSWSFHVVLSPQENISAEKPHLQGKVHQFRLSLWAEHTGTSNPSFRRPHRIGKVNNMFWNRSYTAVVQSLKVITAHSVNRWIPIWNTSLSDLFNIHVIAPNTFVMLFAGCVREMNKIANGNWKLFISDHFPTTSHLIKYPIAIQHSGQVI